MIGIVRLFPTEAFLTREFTLVVWKDRLNNICVRVFLQKKRVVIDEVFRNKSGKLCIEAKMSRWEHRVSNFGPSIDCAPRDDQGGACVSKNNIVWVVHVFIREKSANGKEELFPKRIEVGQQDNEDQNLCLRTSWWLSDLKIHIHVLSRYSHEYRPPPAYQLRTVSYVRHMSSLNSV